MNILITGNPKSFRSSAPETVDKDQIYISYYKSQYHNILEVSPTSASEGKKPRCHIIPQSGLQSPFHCPGHTSQIPGHMWSLPVSQEHLNKAQKQWAAYCLWQKQRGLGIVSRASGHVGEKQNFLWPQGSHSCTD